MSEISTTGFDYSSLNDEEEASKLRYFAKSGHALIRKSQIRYVADMGKLLSEARDVLSKHKEGKFIKWVTAEFDFDKTTAYRYITAWERILSHACDDYLHWTQSALYLACADDFPKPVMKQLQKIPPTELVRAGDVKRLIEASKPEVTYDDPPFDDDSEETQADPVAAKEKAKADAKAAREKAKADKQAAREKAKADAKAAREKAKADKQAAKMAALPTDEQARLIRIALQQHIDRAVRLADDLHRVKRNQSKRVMVVKLLQDAGLNLW